jgi:membrane protein implicated in regulation of membrane protease activity
MDEFIRWLWDVSPWHWWAAGVMLITIEVFAPSTFLIGPSVAAGIVGVVVFFLPELDWRLQVLLFVVLALLVTLLLFAWLKRYPLASDQPNLNSRGQGYVGRRYTLEEALIDGRGRLHIDDTWWQAAEKDGQPLEAGTKIEIVGIDGAVLRVQASAETINSPA